MSEDIEELRKAGRRLFWQAKRLEQEQRADAEINSAVAMRWARYGVVRQFRFVDWGPEDCEEYDLWIGILDRYVEAGVIPSCTKGEYSFPTDLDGWTNNLRLAHEDVFLQGEGPSSLNPEAWLQRKRA